MNNPAVPSWILTLVCADRVGIVAAVSQFLAERGGFITDSQQYADREAGRFFMRVAFEATDDRMADTDRLCAEFAGIGAQFSMDWSLTPSNHRPRMLIAVSKGSHCLADLLHRWQTGMLAIDIMGVVSNHPDMRRITEWHGIPYHELPPNGDKAVQETSLLDIFDRTRSDYLILARYMQVLSDALVTRIAGRCINIHHSFLPSFKGARPYHRAHDRGVKLIGATAHFVTAELDEGPIIEQAVERVDHRATAEDMIRIGRDIEAQVLARAVGWIADRRVLLNGGKTVVFR
ncbi:formyltetrahydrofolate deformylase [Sphingobium quisquiliarum P25]|uniref:Formyltetrahydrofolate deformylase n=1 Tax=Sphingobium quisquiliarum P25 TaxID=1329909 RepID=T0HAR7_9SPHN|nr:formyltetrahydrofolate deformylase [Sphingobium quisquiliarum]EQB10112.1 formyltetrahydrofolate deformylase [Sphingobium quisquiliarum P25]